MKSKWFQGNSRIPSAHLLLVAAVSGVTPVAVQAAAQGEPYSVGMSGYITGPGAADHAPSVEGFRAYIERLNARGGINGHPVKLSVLDDRAEPARGADNARRLADEKHHLVTWASLSPTYRPALASAEESGVPLMFIGNASCPDQALPKPKAHPMVFCASSVLIGADLEFLVQYALKAAPSGAKFGLLAADIPVSRLGADTQEKQFQSAGRQVAEKLALPLATPDYGPAATRFLNAGVGWINQWGPFGQVVGVLRAARSQGWKGTLLSAVPFENELEKIRDDKLLLATAVAFAKTVKHPALREIEEAGKAVGATFQSNQMTAGWLGGIVVEAALKACGWPCTPAQLAKAMSTLTVDTQGFIGGPIDWTPENHARSKAYYQVYRWSSERGSIVRELDWTPITVR